MSGSRRLWSALLAVFLLFSCLSMVYGQAEGSLTVLVRDPLGSPIGGLEVRLIRGEEVRKFVTNSTGYAEFRHLSPGEYLLKAKLDNVTVAEKLVKVPEEREVSLTALLSTIRLKLMNLDGEPVGGLELKMESAGYKVSAKSNEKGVIRLERIPYSGLEGVGSYSMKIEMKGILVYERSLEVDEPMISENITIPLLSLRLTIVNLEGEPVPRLKVKLSSEGYSAEREAGNGTALFKNLPSSSLEGVGAYEINVSMRTAGGYMPIYSEKRAFESSQSLSLIADLAKLSVKVVDKEGSPVRGIRVLLSNELMENFTLGATDKNGVAVFKNVPLSRGRVSAGAYSAMVFRAGKLIGEERFEVMKVEETVKLVVERGEVRLKILDHRGNPLAGYQITLVDQLSGEKYNGTTDERGEAVFRIFYGPYDLEVYKDGKLIHSSQVRLGEKSVELRLKEVNFPITIQVVDALGAPISSARMRLYSGGELLLDRDLNGEPITLSLPQPAELRCDIYSDAGQLIHRESIYASEPSSHLIELKDYVYLNGLVRLEPIASGIVLTMFAASLLFSAILLRRVRRKG